jgi:hypothetical protein
VRAARSRVNPDVVRAIDNLRASRILSEHQAAPLMRVARGDLVSLHLELRTLLYAGVLLVTGGVGLFLKQNADRLGPTAIIVLLGAAAAVCVSFVWRRSAAFSWRKAESPHLALDFVLLLGVLLIGADLAYAETRIGVLGPDWPFHLLVVALVATAAAYRFAAWRGVAISLSVAALDRNPFAAARANALGCGALFVAAAILSVRSNRKAHFEGVWGTLGLLLVFGGLLSGVFSGAAPAWFEWALVLWGVAAAVVVTAYRLRRATYFVLGVGAAYLALLRLLAEAVRGTSMLFLAGLSSIAVIVLLVRAQRRMKDAQ